MLLTVRKMLDKLGSQLFLAFRLWPRYQAGLLEFLELLGTIWNDILLLMWEHSKGGKDMYLFNVKGRTALTPWAMKMGSSQSTHRW